MRLLSHGTGDAERVAVLVADGAIEVAELLGDGPWTMDRLIGAGPGAIARLIAAIATADQGATRPIAYLEVIAPVPRPGKIVAVGRNYREHAAEEGVAVLPDPIVFTKFPSSVVAPEAPITWRADASGQVDYEAELAVVIGTRCRDVAVADALDTVFGYTCLNDVSARDLQVQDGQWVRAKSLDTFCPLGPWVVTRDEIPDPMTLAIQCRVNGEVRQAATTGEMVHGVAELIAFCSRYFTLEPGDVIATGTPGGVGLFRDPPVFLADGDVVEVEIEGIGTLRNPCVVTSE